MEKEYMKIALKEAMKANKHENIPVGAVIVKNNKIISKAHNNKEQTNLVTSHAEIIAIEKACKRLKDWRLNGCIMYVTLQPCLMCEEVLVESRIDKVIYAVENKNRANKSKKNTIFEETNTLTSECQMILKDFFKNKRK